MVTEGVYSIVRHPMYLTTTLFALALPFLLLNYVASFPFLIIPVGLYYRSKKEEQLWIKQFGKKYVSYKATTPGIIPRLCPKKFSILKLN